MSVWPGPIDHFYLTAFGLLIELKYQFTPFFHPSNFPPPPFFLGPSLLVYDSFPPFSRIVPPNDFGIFFMKPSPILRLCLFPKNNRAPPSFLAPPPSPPPSIRPASRGTFFSFPIHPGRHLPSSLTYLAILPSFCRPGSFLYSPCAIARVRVALLPPLPWVVLPWPPLRVGIAPHANPQLPFVNFCLPPGLIKIFLLQNRPAIFFFFFFFESMTLRPS